MTPDPLNDRTAPRRNPEPHMDGVDMSRPRTTLLLTLAFLVGVFVARWPALIALLTGDDAWTLRVGEILRLIERRYVEPVERERLVRGAIDGMLQALNDPYTTYVPASDSRTFEKELTGAFVGIGAQIEIREGQPTIVTPLEDSPALRAGILPGDRILKINGAPAHGLVIEDLIARLTGEPGTMVRLTVERNTDSSSGASVLELDIVRGPIRSRVVKGVRFMPGRGWDFWLSEREAIAYVRLTQFTPSIAHEFREVLARWSSGHSPSGAPRVLILDLRGNGGGMLEQAVEIADLFLDEGELLSIRGRPDGLNERIMTNRGRVLPTTALAVLVDAASASASEILAGALQLRAGAVVIGERTFGKGLVQSIAPLRFDPGAQLKYSEAYYTLPDGRVIHRSDDSELWGVDPTPGFLIRSPEGPAQRMMTQARRVFDAITPEGVERRMPAELAAQRWDDPEWLEGSMGDAALAAALRSARAFVREGRWIPITPVDSPEQLRLRLAAEERTNLRRRLATLELERSRLQRRLESVSDLPPTQDRTRLWAEGRDPQGGRMLVSDREGNVLATLAITEPGLESWLLLAGLRPTEGSTIHPEPHGSPGMSPQTNGGSR
jgi:carboxyl-terminal processing protease